MTYGGNKSSLISFLVSKWRKPDYTKHLNGKVLFVTTEKKCYKITTEGHQKVLELQSTHEVHTLLMLHRLDIQQL